MLCDVMMCSRCGSRRQITNTKFFSLTLPISSTFYFSIHHLQKRPGGELIQPVERTIIHYLKHSIYIQNVLFLLIPLFWIVYGNLQLLMKLKVSIVKGLFVCFFFMYRCGVLNSLLDPSSLPDHLSSPQRNVAPS